MKVDDHCRHNRVASASSNVKLSVVNRFADTLACFFCGRCPCYTKTYTLQGIPFYAASFTRANWIFAANVVCLITHSVFAWLSFNSCNATRLGVRVNTNCTVEAMQIRITRPATNWTAMMVDDAYKPIIKDVGHPVRIDHLTGWFFLTSAIFHALAVAVAPFDIFMPLYWKQIDNAFAPWRWIEYSFSAPIMLVSLFLLSGIRSQNTLILAFGLMSSVQFFGLLTELLSRPAERDEHGYRGWKGDPVRPNIVMLQACVGVEFQSISNPQTTLKEDEAIRNFKYAYFINLLKRAVPHFLGWIPFVLVWTVYLSSFASNLTDMKTDNTNILSSVPDWLPWAIGGTLSIFSCFALVQVRYLWLSPDEFWKAELWYCALSATAKVFLGLILLVNVLAYASVAEALDNTAAGRARIPRLEQIA